MAESKALDAEILEVLKKSLPQHVCGMVKDELEQMAEFRKENEYLKDLSERQAEDLEMYRKLCVDADKVKADQKRLDEDRRALAEEKAVFERNKKVFELETKLAAERDKVMHAQTINNSLVRNVEYRRNVMTTGPVAVDGGSGYSGHVETHTTTENVTEGAD